ncbi:MAG: hypothetical protein SFW64_09300 [Alphaproteobacteria bacterium]|nr:hypothetical protein [Alphaproteobacteria bacterium]
MMARLTQVQRFNRLDSRTIETPKINGKSISLLIELPGMSLLPQELTPEEAVTNDLAYLLQAKSGIVVTKTDNKDQFKVVLTDDAMTQYNSLATAKQESLKQVGAAR